MTIEFDFKPRFQDNSELEIDYTADIICCETCGKLCQRVGFMSHLNSCFKNYEQRNKIIEKFHAGSKIRTKKYWKNYYQQHKEQYKEHQLKWKAKKLLLEEGNKMFYGIDITAKFLDFYFETEKKLPKKLIPLTEEQKDQKGFFAIEDGFVKVFLRNITPNIRKDKDRELEILFIDITQDESQNLIKTWTKKNELSKIIPNENTEETENESELEFEPEFDEWDLYLRDKIFEYFKGPINYFGRRFF